MIMHTQYTTNFIESAVGEKIIVGPIEYIVIFEGTHEAVKMFHQKTRL